MQRYFVNQKQFIDDKVIINNDDVHHITKVLRSSIGDNVIISNGDGYDVIAEISVIEPKQVICKIVSEIKDNREPNVEIILAQGLPKSDKMDLIIQKSTEIGVSKIIPFTSDRTIVQLNEKKEQKRLERWRKITKEASEQAHRSIIPEISPLVTFNKLLEIMGEQLTLIAYEKENSLQLYQALNKIPDINKVLLVIGPEGGFTGQEVKKVVEQGAYSISLGKRILRTETAGLVGISNILYHLEGMK